MYSDPAEIGLKLRSSVVADDQAAVAFLAEITPQTVAANPALLRLAHARRVLLLQGPVGPFFDRLARWAQLRGARVTRVAFHAGDCHDSQLVEPILFQQSPDLWPRFFEALVAIEQPDCVVLFGQSRRHHQVALRIAADKGIAVIVTEEGYVRPGHLTMELEGVNGLSSTLSRYRWVCADEAPNLPPAPREKWLWQKMAWHACRHYFALSRGADDFPLYEHHRPTSVVRHSTYWIRSLGRKYLHSIPDRTQVQRLASARDYFLVPLQLEGDSQIAQHSRYRCNHEFIYEVLQSFAEHAPPHTRIVFKQHPHSRGGPGHAGAVRQRSHELGVLQRVVYLIEGHTPTLVEHSLGVVVINSTVGLQALARKRPLKVMGEALYSLPGLTYQGSLDTFWPRRPTPQPGMVESFIDQLLHLTQVPCHVYGLRNAPLPWRIEPQGRTAP